MIINYLQGTQFFFNCFKSVKKCFFLSVTQLRRRLFAITAREYSSRRPAWGTQTACPTSYVLFCVFLCDLGIG